VTLDVTHRKRTWLNWGNMVPETGVLADIVSLGYWDR
jgi:hypothetical protein